MERIAAALPSGYHLEHVTKTNSTNDDAKRWLDAGATPRALFVADCQTGGRGRRGREWLSPIGNLYASLVVPKPDDAQRLGHYGFCISLAICEAIGDGAAVKWPNDVLLGGGKCAGILLEVAGDGLIIGFGVNIAHMPDDAGYKVAKLSDTAPGRSVADWCAAIVERFFLLRQLSAGDLLARWTKSATGLHNAITVRLPGRELHGIFKGLSDDGALLLEHDGQVQPIYAGDVFIGPHV